MKKISRVILSEGIGHYIKFLTIEHVHKTLWL